MNVVHIALAADENYRAGLLVTACSIAEHASRDAELLFHVVDGGVAEASWGQLTRKLAELHPKVSLDRIDLATLKNCMSFDGLMPYHGNYMSYVRLALPFLLPEVKRCIYCDVDFLWMADVAELWREADSWKPCQSVAEPCAETLDLENAWCSARQIPFQRDRYFCAGLSFFNLDLARQTKTAERTLDFLRRYPDVPFADQTALNAVLGGNVRLLDEKWQRLSVALRGLSSRPDFVLHYAGDIPWRLAQPSSILSDAVLLWHDHYARYTGQSRGSSLREFFSPRKIFFSRLYWHLVRCPLTRVPFFAVLSATGHRKCRQGMLNRCVRVPMT